MTEDLRINRNKIRQFKCKNCGGELQLQNKRSQYVACPYCGSVADSSSEAYKVLTKMDKPSKFPPMRFIRIGMEGTFNGKMHHVIGRTRRRNTYREYWVENGETGYSDEVWIFDEWLLISEDATYFTLVEDEEGFTVVNSITPRYPSLPQGERMQDFYSGKQKRVQEYGNTEILYYEGESTYLVQAGDKSSFSEYSGGGSSYSAEWRHKEGVLKEIEFFKETPISNNEVLEAFNLKKANTAKPKRKLSQPATRQVKRLKNKYIILFAAVINILLGLGLAMFTTKPAANEDTVGQNINMRELAKTKGWTKVNDTLKEVTYRAKLDLKPSTKMIKFSYRHSVADSLKCISIVYLTDENGDTLLRNKQYAYNIKTTKKEAFKAATINENFMRDSTFNTIIFTARLQVNKNWNPKRKKDTEHWVKFNQVDQLYTSDDTGEGNMGLGFVLLIVGAIWPKRL